MTTDTIYTMVQIFYWIGLLSILYAAYLLFKKIMKTTRGTQ